MRLKKERDYIIRGEKQFERKWIKIALTDPFVCLLGIAFFTSSVAINGFGVFLPTIIDGLGFASLKVNYMTIPVHVLGAISLTIQVYYSDKLGKRAYFIVGCCVPVVAGYLMPVISRNPDVGYAGMFVLVVGLYPISTLAVTWITTNLAPDSKRAIGQPFAYSLANLSNLYGLFTQGPTISQACSFVGTGVPVVEGR